MKRIALAAVLGAAIYFVWGMLTWMVIPLHTPTINSLPTEDTITAALQSQDLATGVYSAPGFQDPSELSDPDSAFMKNHQAGPIYSIYYHREGLVPLNAGTMVVGFLLDLVAAAIAACLLSGVGTCCQNYWCRVGFVLGLGVFVAVVGHLSYWNWMLFPLDYTVAFVIDNVVGWGIAGLAIAAIIRPAEPAVSHDTAHVSKPAARPAVAAPPALPPQPLRNDAINLLATLQREARFVDIVKEPLQDYSDAQVGAAARDVLRDCGAVLDRLFQLEPLLEQAEGADVELPQSADTAKYRVTGQSGGDTPNKGKLAHHGWTAKRCELPTWSGSKDAALVVAPAEVEVK